MFRETQEAGTSSTENHGDAEGWSAIDNFDLCSEKHKRQEHQAPTTMLYRNAQETESRNAKYPKVKQAEYPKENTERTGIFI